MELVIEATWTSPARWDCLPLSVCHYGEQNGDAMRDPEMCFELGFAGGAHLDPYLWRNDYVAVEQVSLRHHPRSLRRASGVAQAAREVRWLCGDNNLRLQGFLEAFTDSCILG